MSFIQIWATLEDPIDHNEVFKAILLNILSINTLNFTIAIDEDQIILI